jgi:hypothetical protein
MEKPPLRRLHRTLYQHRWQDIEDWTRAFNELAELDDHDLLELTRLSRGDRHEEE